MLAFDKTEQMQRLGMLGFLRKDSPVQTTRAAECAGVVVVQRLCEEFLACGHERGCGIDSGWYRRLLLGCLVLLVN
jgi:hypothetical protein